MAVCTGLLWRFKHYKQASSRSLHPALNATTQMTSVETKLCKLSDKLHAAWTDADVSPLREATLSAQWNQDLQFVQRIMVFVHRQVDSLSAAMTKCTELSAGMRRVLMKNGAPAFLFPVPFATEATLAHEGTPTNVVKLADDDSEFAQAMAASMHKHLLRELSKRCGCLVDKDSRSGIVAVPDTSAYRALGMLFVVGFWDPLDAKLCLRDRQLPFCDPRRMQLLMQLETTNTRDPSTGSLRMQVVCWETKHVQAFGRLAQNYGTSSTALPPTATALTSAARHSPLRRSRSWTCGAPAPCTGSSQP